MAISDDWDFDYVNKELRHVDGILSYDGNTGTAPALNDYVIGGTSGAVGRIIAGSDLGGTSATGTLTLTNVTAGGATGAQARFINNETLRVLSEVAFDTIGGSPQGFGIGDTLTGPTTESIDVQFIEYNQGPKVTLAGEGSIYGDNLTSGFANNEQIDVDATPFGIGDGSGATAVALVNTGAETDNSALFPTCLVNGTLAVPGATNENDSAIIHYDGSPTIAIPEDAKISDTTTGAVGFAQQVVGVLATGSIRLVDSDTSGGAWSDGNGIDLEDMVFYNAQVAGEVFLEGAVYEGQTSGERFRVLAVRDDGDSTGALITAGRSAGAMTLAEDIHRILAGDVLGNKIAEVESLTTVLATGATLNLPDGVRLEQRTYQGGIFGATVSLNIRRSANALFSYVQDTLDELGQLDDDPILDGTFRDNVYELLDGNGWEIPDLSFRFLEKGGFTDTSANNVWTNDQSVMSRVVQANGYLPTASAPRPHPNAYMEQDGKVIPQFWLEGDINAIIKVKSTTSVTAIAPATPALGQLIDGGNRLWYNRELGDSYDHFPSSQVGGVATIPLTTAPDQDNLQGEFRYPFNTGGAGAFTVGEEITATTAGVLKVGIVTASDSGATGNVDYILKSPTDFADADVITGDISTKSATLAATKSNLIAGYSTDIKTMWVDRRFTGGSTTVATFIVGEQVSQAVSGYDGFVLEDDAGTIYVQDVPGTAAPDATNQLSGDTSGALNTPTGVADFTTVPKDMGDGSGDLNYSGVSSGDITGASAQTIQKVYEWDKYLTRKEETTVFDGVGAASGVQGRIYRGFVDTFTESKSAPLGTFAGGTMTGAQGHFIDKDTLVAADLQKMVSTDNDGLAVFPPNLQAYLISNVAAGWRVGGYRSTGSGLTAILTTEFQIGAGNVAGNSTIVVQAGTRSVSPLPSDVPDTGVLRIEDPSTPGIFLRAIYDSVNRGTNTFSLQSGIGQDTIGDITGAVGLTQTDNCFVAFIEEEAAGASVSNNIQYVADIDAVTRARKKGFKHFIAAGVFGATGLSQGVVQTPDPSVNLP
jgi:hypothetical protein